MNIHNFRERAEAKKFQKNQENEKEREIEKNEKERERIERVKIIKNRMEKYKENKIKAKQDIIKAEQDIIAFKEIIRKAYKNIEQIKRAEINEIIANVPSNSNIFLTNITSLITNNSYAPLFQQLFKKYLLKEGVDEITIGNIFTEIFTRNPLYILDVSTIVNRRPLASGSYGIVFPNKSINKSKLTNNVQSVPIIIKIVRNADRDPLYLFHFYKESLIQYILYNLSDSQFKINIPKIYSIKSIDNSPSIIMEQVEGDILVNVFNKKLPNLLQFINYIKQLFLLLQYLYNTFGFVHNDIKNDNIMIRNDNTIVLLDYGYGSINKLPSIGENPNFSLSVYDNLYNLQQNSLNSRPYVDILMTLKMYNIMLKFYNQSYFAKQGITNINKLKHIKNILKSLHINTGVLELLVNTKDEHHSIFRKMDLTSYIQSTAFSELTYERILFRINEIEKIFQNGSIL